MYDVQVPLGQLISAELALKLADITEFINREISLYISRSGQITNIVIGGNDSVELPAVEGRRGIGRLSGIRCVHTHPNGNPVLSGVDFSALKNNKFDAMVTIGVTAPDYTQSIISFGMIVGLDKEEQFICDEYGPFSLEEAEAINFLNVINTIERILDKQTSSSSLAVAAEKTILVGMDWGQIKGGWDEEASIYENGKICPSPVPVSQHDADNPANDEAKPLYYEQKPLYCERKPEVYEQQPVNRLSQKPVKLPVHMESMLHDIEFRQSNRSADFIAGVDEAESSQRFINRGRLLHTLFSAIETEKDIDNAISQLVFEGVIGRSETEEEIRNLTQRAFSLPQVKDWYSGTWQLFNECDIIWQENGELRTRRPDRVMMRGEEIVVVDFKFGKPNKKYNKQVQGYMQLLVRMGYVAENIRGYLWYVEENNIEPV